MVFGGCGRYYYLNPDGSQCYAYGSWKLFINTNGQRRWIPLQREFAYSPEKMNARLIYNFSGQLIYRETRDCLGYVAAPSLGTLIMRYNQEVVQEYLDTLECRINSVIRRQHWERVKKVAWDEIIYLEWKTGLWYGEWLEKERKRLQDKGQYSEYNVLVDDELKRVMRDNGVEDIKEENVEEGTIEQENVKKENVKKENVKKENVKKENVKKENVKKENVKKENVKGEIIKEEPTEEIFIKIELSDKISMEMKY
ncbi:hypothetical protein ACHAP3_009796 [Botrytis cinerea]